MRYVSTNRDLPNGFREKVGFRDALFMGQAPDQGLFMPEQVPKLEPDTLRGLKGRPFAETAAVVLEKFLEGAVSRDDLRAITEEAYDFDIPLESGGQGAWILRLDQGPTGSFKDIAARMLARLMGRLRADEGKMTVLVATSGDTGSAVGEAFRDLEGVRTVILYPEEEVSPFQKRQLDAIGGNAVSAAVTGSFDDCQELVKQAFSDPDLRAFGLTSANSINIGRVLPQAAYYVHAYAQVAEDGEEIVFSIPSGNFGNALGAEIARRMGVPMRRIITATNENDAFPVFLRTGVYRRVQPSKRCLSNAMNVGHPSNLARFFDLYGGTLDRFGRVHKVPNLREMRTRLHGVSISDDRTVGVMRKVYNACDRVLEPHGAVAWAGLESYRLERRDRCRAVVLSTAHPAKFPEIVRNTLGLTPEPTPALAAFSSREGNCVRMPADGAALKKLLSEAQIEATL